VSRLFTGSIARRLYSLLLIVALGFGAIVAYQLVALRQNLDSFKRTEIQSVVESAAGVVENFYTQAQAGVMTTAAAQTAALEALRHMRYGVDGAEYLFVDGFDYVNRMHAYQPEKEGTVRRDVTDGNGKLYLAELIGTAQAQGSSFVSYAFRDTDGSFRDKITYGQAFAPWGWVISSGVLLTTVEAIFWQAALTSAMITGGAMLVVLLLGGLIARSIGGPIQALTRDMVRLADNDFDVELAGQQRSDEIGDMARAVAVFRENAMKISQMTEAEAARILADAAARQRMMAELQAAFGQVVDAASAGDFSQRVAAKFADPELDALAVSINKLVDDFSHGVTGVGQMLAALANTDLTQRMEGDYAGAFGRLQHDVNAVADRLGEVVGRLRSTSGSLKTATGEILSGANDLSERTTKQAATIEETSAAMEQLAGTVTQNAQRARDASIKAVHVTQTAEEGGQVMNAATEAMDRISQSSAKISNIIGMIDDIAFQTNLLALNASVEAARAGDAGKGFAVVAVEVRRLAQSAAQASSDVKALIETSGGDVKSGSRLVGEAAGKLRALLDAATDNRNLLESIANDSLEQAAAIDQVTTAVRQMDEMTQHNAALVEETNAAIEQTEAQASELDGIVEVFRVGAAAQPARAIATSDARGLQRRLAAVGNRLGTQGNVALAADWDEF
jgi:methyl-accepting chemotaxis protein